MLLPQFASAIKPVIVRQKLFSQRNNLYGKAPVIDSDGFRPNVGIILTNNAGQLLWARRVGGQDAWQFPQGGINESESPEDALFRELQEEVGLLPHHVEVIGCTRGWLRYRLPDRLVRHNSQPLCIGQKQKWFLLQFKGDESHISLNNGGRAEFDDWRWVSYWYPLGKVVSFKKDVYRRALKELSPVHAQLDILWKNAESSEK